MFQELNNCHTIELLDHNMFLNWELFANSRILIKSTNCEIKSLVDFSYLFLKICMLLLCRYYYDDVMLRYYVIICIITMYKKYVVIIPYSQLRYNFQL